MNMDTPEKLKAALDKISDQIKSQAEQAEKEIKAHAKLSEETRAAVDKLLTQQGELQARLQTAEQLVAKLETGGGAPARPLSMGEQVTASEDFQAFAQNPRGTFRMGVQAAIGSGSSSAGDLIVPDRVPGIVMPGLPHDPRPHQLGPHDQQQHRVRARERVHEQRRAGQ